jgi:hypothetical protein
MAIASSHALGAKPGKSVMLLPGQTVEIRSPSEILATLGADGALDGLPFMPEMVQYCGRRFRVLRRLEKICYDSFPMHMREFNGNDVVYLEGLHCSGVDHGSCKKSCPVFWKEAWLRKSDGERSVAASGPEPAQALRARLKTATPAGTYFCQSTELAQATFPLTRGRRVLKWFRDARERTYPWRQMPGLVLLPIVRKLRRKLVGETLRGNRAPTPTETLNLQPGEWVEVKPLKAILQTLDANGKNRGLHFSEDMAAFCGRAFRVRDRLDRMISEVTGQMQEMKNTVILEDVRCACPYTLGGCPRGSFQYWREIWLRRLPQTPNQPGPTQ